MGVFGFRVWAFGVQGFTGLGFRAGLLEVWVFGVFKDVYDSLCSGCDEVSLGLLGNFCGSRCKIDFGLGAPLV